MIAGIDEVGRGPWAGPLVVGAVVLGSAAIDGLTDSKKLSKKKLKEYDRLIREQAAGYGLGWVSAAEIDAMGLSEALRLATRRALEKITTPYYEIVIDGTVNFLRNTPKEQYVTVLKKADLLIASVSAASIIAKVARDAYMVDQAEIYPEYGFAQHVGYGTATHRQAIDKHGITPLHRLSFAPLKKYNQKNSSGGSDAMVHRAITAKQRGDQAETAVCEFLQRDNFAIVDRNWRTKYCEIDIVAEKNGTVYFVEVKYRYTFEQGGGMAAITPKKLSQMKFAAELYVANHCLNENDLRLAAIAVSGETMNVGEIVLL